MNGCAKLMLVERPEIVRLMGVDCRVTVGVRGVDVESYGKPSMVYDFTPFTG